MPKDYGRRMPFDVRMLRVIERSPAMLEEQGSGFLQDWGGVEGYKKAAEMTPEARQVYYAVVEGYSEPSQIEVATGLRPTEVSSGIQELQRKGMVFVED